MPSVKPAELAQWAGDVGFKGEARDFAGMKKALEDSGAIYQHDGKDLKWSDVEVVAPTFRTTSAPKAEAKAADPADLELKVKSAVEAAMKANGEEVAKGQRPPPVTSKGSEVEVGKSGRQMWYDDRKKSGQAVFDDLEMAEAYCRNIAAKAAITEGKVDAAHVHTKRYIELCEAKGYNTASTAAGGAVVVDQFDNRIINLVKEFGIARRLCTVFNMGAKDVIRPKVTGTHTVYYPDEGGAATQSTQTFSNVSLRAKKGVTFVRLSDEIIADASIDMIEHATRECARAIAKIEDESLFNGDGSVGGTTYIPGVTGIVNKFGTTATTDSRSHTGADTSDLHDAADLFAFMGLAPEFMGTMKAWHGTPEMLAIVLLRLAQNVGGATVEKFVGFGDREMTAVLNYPVMRNNVMNKSVNTSADTVDLLFGDISQAAWFGDRQGVEVATSKERYFDTMELALRLTVRHDILVHDLGSTTTQSPVVALFQT